ncbi:thiamine pyrophosphate-dependent enzyme [Chloroflexota bacterium]
MAPSQTDTYLNEEWLPYPFCPGCGHSAILNNLNQALIKLQLDFKKVVIISDIGCSGLSDKFFNTNALHGLHGRSVTYATGIKLANPDLKVIVLIGDGGCGIGGHHLLNAARRNIGVTTLVFNNLNYGMTGGQHSITTPQGANTSTTRYGHLEQPLDICSTFAVNGASYVARTTAYDKTLPYMIADAIENDGFSIIDIWELCTAYFVPNNKFNRKQLETTIEKFGFETGVFQHISRPEYSSAYRKAVSNQFNLDIATSPKLEPKYTSSLEEPIHFTIAGAAGKKIVTAATKFSQGAILAGLHATQRSQYPVTVQTGFSLSEVFLSKDEIPPTSINKSKFLVILFQEGLEKVKPILNTLTARDSVFINSQLEHISTSAKLIRLDLQKTKKKSYWAIAALAEVLRQTNAYPLEAFIEAVSLSKKFTEKNLAAIEASEEISENL